MPAPRALEPGRLLQSARIVLRGKPVRARHLRHAAEQALLGARAHQKVIATGDDKGRAPAKLAGFSWRFARKTFLIATSARDAAFVQGTERASRLSRRTDGRPQIHQRLRTVARAR